MYLTMLMGLLLRIKFIFTLYKESSVFTSLRSLEYLTIKIFHSTHFCLESKYMEFLRNVLCHLSLVSFCGRFKLIWFNLHSRLLFACKYYVYILVFCCSSLCSSPADCYVRYFDDPLWSFILNVKCFFI